jgi:hypothetical protein
MSSAKKLDAAKAFKLARILEAHLREHGPSYAHQSMMHVVESLALPVALHFKAIPSLSAGSLALACLLEYPGHNDKQIAKQVGCSTKTLTRDARYQAGRELMKQRKGTFFRKSQT